MLSEQESPKSLLKPNGAGSYSAEESAGGLAPEPLNTAAGTTNGAPAAGGDGAQSNQRNSIQQDEALSGAAGGEGTDTEIGASSEVEAAGGSAGVTDTASTNAISDLAGGTRGDQSQKPHHVYAPSTPLLADKSAAAGVGNNPNYITQGSTAHFTVAYDSTLGNNGINAAKYLLQYCESDFQVLQNEFGGITPASLPFQVQLTPGNGGASHATCLATTISIGANSGSGLDFMRQLLIAEEDEVFMASFGHGWNCGASNGEGLSRVLANDLTPGAEPANFMSAATWLDTPGRPDWVDNTENTDRDYVSIGCSVLFLNWMRFQLGYSWKQIIAAGASTLSGTYQNLTGKTDAFATFSAFMQAHFPAGTPSGLKTDNPFPISTVRYAGVFRPGNGAEWVVPAQPWPQMSNTINTYFKQGLYMDSLDMTVEGSTVLYSGVFRAGSGAEWVVPAQQWPQMSNTINTYFKQGLYMTSISVVLFNGQLFYSGVFRPGSGAEWVVPAQPWSQMSNTINTYFKQGLYATALTAEYAGADVVYSAVFRPGSGTEWVVPAQPWSQMSNTINTYFKQSLDMTALDTIKVNGSTFYTGVFRPGSGAEWVEPGLYWDKMSGKVSDYFKQGLYMTAITTLP